MGTTDLPESARAFEALNPRQQATILIIYELSRAAGPGAAVDFAHDPPSRDVFGRTQMQSRLSRRGWDNPGNGSTVAALSARGMIRRASRPTAFGVMRTVQLTPAGTAAASAGAAAGGEAVLRRRAWEVLALLWAAGQQGEPLSWSKSTTIDKVLIGRHDPPLAGLVPGGYQITTDGERFYRDAHAAHAAAHPDVTAPDPHAAAASGWPAQADEILARHRERYQALRTEWQQASAAARAAGEEAAVPLPPLPAALPEEITGQAAERHRLWTETARQRAELAARHAQNAGESSARAGRAYAAAAGIAFRAATGNTSPLKALRHAGLDTASAQDAALPPSPDETGVNSIDAEARRLHALAAAGAPPAPRSRRRPSRAPRQAEPPGAAAAALADFLSGHTAGGALSRQLNTPAGQVHSKRCGTSCGE